LTAFFATQVTLGIARDPLASVAQDSPTAVVVVPAHNEESVIGAALHALIQALGDNMRILVVADNCTDRTAELARQGGYEVIERNDERRRGKGYALAFAAAELKRAPPEVVVVIDADCEIDTASLRAIVDECAASNRPCQAVNLIRPCLGGSPLVQISTFAFFVKNSVRQRGLQRMARRVHLTGTGMALPFALFRRTADLGGSVVEDLAFGLELAGTGHPARLVDRAVVWSGASTQSGTMIQRRRWEGGFLSLSLRQGWRLVRRGIAKFDLRSSLAGMDLLIPPLALFAILNTIVLAVAALVVFVLDLSWWPVILYAATLALAFFAVAAAWLGEGRKFISASALMRIPLYVVWKLPLYAGIVRRGAPSEWLRTGR
jgi:cellulose synthase/poly-beta-1,6-N-acetylglucosamine synthase-like glycosyltransferase